MLSNAERTATAAYLSSGADRAEANALEASAEEGAADGGGVWVNGSGLLVLLLGWTGGLAGLLVGAHENGALYFFGSLLLLSSLIAAYSSSLPS